MTSPEATSTSRFARSDDQAAKDSGTSEGRRISIDAQLRRRRTGNISMEDTNHQGTPNDASSSRTRFPHPSRRTTSFTTTASMESLPGRGSFRSHTLSRSSSRPILSPEVPGVDMDKHEPDLWHSAPLLFAVLPAIGGLVFRKGSVIITDLALLILAGIYLNWCLVTPWKWYNQARRIQLAQAPSNEFAEGPALMDDPREDAQAVGGLPGHLDGDASLNNDRNHTNGSASPRKDSMGGKQHLETIEQQVGENTAPNADSFPAATVEATDAGSDPFAAADTELARHETLALAFTFLGPLVGAVILHHVRAALTTSTFHADELVSNMHLTLFVLGAELRPIRHCMKLIHNRTLHLQRVVREDPHALPTAQDNSVSSAETADHLADLTTRLNELERSAADTKATSTANSPSTPQAPQTNANTPSPPLVSQDHHRKSTAQLQTQIDALNRAVRRYEKRATAQTLQTDSRLRDLEARLQDALTLAAVAARDTQKPSFVRVGLGWVGKILMTPVRVARASLAMAMWASEWGLVEVLGLVGGYRESRQGTRRLRVGTRTPGKMPARDGERLSTGVTTGNGAGSNGMRRMR